MPQLSQVGEIYASQLFWLAIAFALIYFGIGRAMVPRIEATVVNRDRMITSDLDAAHAANAAVSTLNATYESGMETARRKATDAVNAAKAQASKAGEAKLAANEVEAGERLASAMTRIETATSGALAEVETATVEAVEAIVSRLSGVAVPQSTIQTSVRSELARG